VVVKSDGVWITTDGLRAGDEAWLNVCKAHEVYRGVLLKWGRNNDPDDPITTDDDIEKVIKSARSFSEFKESAATVLQNDVSKYLASSIANDPTLAVKATSPIPEGRIPRYKNVGLVFIHVRDGKLVVEELNAVIASVPVQSAAGTVYHLGVPTPEWKARDETPGFLLYPPTISIWKPSEDESRMINDPTLLPSYLERLEGQTPCRTGEPNVFLRITPSNIDTSHKYKPKEMLRLRNTSVVTWIKPGACPSWSEITTTRPLGCTLSEEYREDHQFAR
jgi:hypothetical protein